MMETCTAESNIIYFPELDVLILDTGILSGCVNTHEYSTRVPHIDTGCKDYPHIQKWPIHRRSSCFFFQIEFYKLVYNVL